MDLYSPEWVDAFNVAVADLAPEEGVSFSMRQVIEDGPDGTLHVTLDVGVDGRGIHLSVDRSEGPSECTPQVTVRTSYDDALRLARGDVDPTVLLSAGRVKVRGDLSVLVAGQGILSEAAARLEPLSQGTTY